MQDLSNERLTMQAVARCVQLADRGRAFAKTLLDFLTLQGGNGAPSLPRIFHRQTAKC